MSKLIVLVRHGEAEAKEVDPQRPLTARGSQQAERVARWAAAAGIRVTQIRHSGKLRAEQTAEIFARHLRPAGGCVATDGLDPNDDVQPVARQLAGETDDVMLVGHLPFLSRLVSQLVVGDAERPVVQFDASGLVVVRRDEGWSIVCVVQPAWTP